MEGIGCLAAVGPRAGGGTDGADGREARGQAGATWLEETDEVWVLETAAASSSPKGFFPQHTVVIMQFLNWRLVGEGEGRKSQSKEIFTVCHVINILFISHE